MRILLALLFATTLLAAAQPPQVPHKMNFAGITLTIRDDARKEIQKDVDALTQSPKHFNIKVERAKTYFPIIEKIFEEERVPDDFKFLSLQESALISDAVSVSNAVGFWQFKDFTAMEMGLRVDKEIDERMNIASASRGAARYIKKNNFYFNNWIYALQSYQMGAGAVLKSVNESQNGAKHMEITSNTYWYVKKFLAHKIAFEDAVKGVGQIQVITYENHSRKDLASIAKEVSLPEIDLQMYNKWAKKGTIPDDRTYFVLIPLIGQAKEIKSLGSIADIRPSAQVEAKKIEVLAKTHAASEERIKINGISAVRALEGENAARFAIRAQVDLSDFLTWNDISISDRILPGQYYLLGKKRTRALVSYHKVGAGESLWQISQQYGVQLRKLKKYNKIENESDLKPEMMLWLTSTKPKDSDGNSDKVVSVATIVQVDDQQSFSWSVTPDQAEISRENKLGSIDPNTEKALEIPTIVSMKKSATVVDWEENVKNAGQMLVPQKNVENKNEHTVLAGETLYAIAQQHQVSIMDIVTLNNLNLQEGIKPGQVLKIIEHQDSMEVITKPEVAPLQIEHEVKGTDTLYSIARKYNVTIKEIMEWNEKKDFSVSVGEKLKVQLR